VFFLSFVPAFFAVAFIARIVVALFVFFLATAVAISLIVMVCYPIRLRESPETDFFAMALSLLCRQDTYFARKRR
jgi:hypothetical protein